MAGTVFFVVVWVFLHSFVPDFFYIWVVYILLLGERSEPQSRFRVKNAWAELRSPNTRMLKKQFWDFETKCKLELPLGILNSTFIRPVKTDL